MLDDDEGDEGDASSTTASSGIELTSEPRTLAVGDVISVLILPGAPAPAAEDVDSDAFAEVGDPG